VESVLPRGSLRGIGVAEFELRKFVAPEFVFGTGARRRVGFYARNFQARRALVVSDRGVAAAGWTAEAVADLNDAGVETLVFNDVTPNPRDDEAASGAGVFRAARCDVIVAVGGGSVIDCAKGIGVLTTGGGAISDYAGVDTIASPGPPLIAVPTTAGTSADVSQFAVFTDTARRAKVLIVSKTVIPDVALVDPVTTSTMGPLLTAHTGIDALSHAIEAFASTAGSPIIDVHAAAAIRAVWEHLPASVRDSGDARARGEVMLGSLQAGLAFSNAGLGAVHALSHPLGGRLDLIHGEVNALLLEHVVDFNFESAPERYTEIARLIGIDTRGRPPAEIRRRLRDALRTFRVSLGVEGGLGTRGLSADMFGEFAEFAVRDACVYTNPRRVSADDARAIYGESL